MEREPGRKGVAIMASLDDTQTVTQSGSLVTSPYIKETFESLGDTLCFDVYTRVSPSVTKCISMYIRW